MLKKLKSLKLTKFLEGDRKARLLSLLILWATIFMFIEPMLAPTGYIVFSDLDFGTNDALYFERIVGLFNEPFSSLNFFNLSRLIFILPFYLLTPLFDDFIPNFLLRSIIWTLLFISATSMYILCEYLLKGHFGKFNSKYHYYGIIIPSLFYAVNPWVIFRIQHIFLLVGYALFPLILRYFFEYFAIEERQKGSFENIEQPPIKEKGFRYILRILRYRKPDAHLLVLIGLFVSIGSAAIHYFFYYNLIFLGLSIFITVYNIIKGSNFKESIKTFIVKSFLLYGTIFLFCSYWLLPYMAATFITRIEPQNVNVIDTLQLFSRNSDFKYVLYLISYWWPMFKMDQSLDSYFWIGGGIFIAIIAFIIFYRYGWHFYVKLFTWTIVIMIIIALGVNQQFTDDFFVFIVTNVPIIGHIFRDPNKLIGPLALFFSVLIAFGVDKLIFFLKQSGFSKIMPTLFITALLCAMFFYYRPFYVVFTKGFYSGVDVPQEYFDVQDKYIPDGKIFWTPTIENMVLSNGIGGYDWNTDENVPGHVKLSGDFHVYSSEKPTIFQHENNNGVISYFQSYLQHVLDSGTGQHLGKILAWLGFNELGFHQDVYGQDERQAFNKKILDEQDDLEKHYEDDIFTLYQTPYKQDKSFEINQVAYVTKGLHSIGHLFDYQKELKFDTDKTGLIWSPLTFQRPSLSKDDLLIGDNKLDFILPQIDKKYFYSPFHSINTGNPYTGWAKTFARTPDWFWTMEANNINNYEWGYDFSQGITYTYTKYKLTKPSYKLTHELGEKILGMDGILNDFFTPELPEIFKLTPFPDAVLGNKALAGTVQKGYSIGNTWKVARSKKINVTGGEFFRLKSIVSGVNAGSLHFKIRFFDDENKELDVAYATPVESLSESIKTDVSSDFYVPKETKYLVIDILSVQNDTKPVYFWIHDFGLYQIMANAELNKLEINMEDYKDESQTKDYRIFLRAFKCSACSEATVEMGNKQYPVNLFDSHNRFEWIDLGEAKIPDGKLSIIPGDGLNIINGVMVIPVNRYKDITEKIYGNLNGNQVDLSLLKYDYDIDVEFPITGLKDVRTSPSSIENSLTPLNKGVTSKTIDILQEDDYMFSITGNLPSTSEYRVIFENEEGEKIELTQKDISPALNRTFENVKGEIQNKENHYFRLLTEDISQKWAIARYDFEKVHLIPGRYQISIVVDSRLENSLDPLDVHLIQSDEVIVPPELSEVDENKAIQYSEILVEQNQIDITKEIKKEKVSEIPVFTIKPTESKQWIINGLNKVSVKKGQVIAFRAQISTSGINQLHSKLLFIDEKNELLSSKQVELVEGKNNEFYIITKVEEDGLVIPAFFFRGDAEDEGKFELRSSEFYFIDDMVKLEGTALLPSVDEKILTNPDKSLYVIQNEAFNPVWELNDSIGPFAINLFHNGFQVKKEGIKRDFKLNPMLVGSYYIGLLTTILTFFVGAYFLYKKYLNKFKKRKRKIVFKGMWSKMKTIIKKRKDKKDQFKGFDESM